MKRATLEATDENILVSIKENTYNRVGDVKEFVQTLDKIEGNMFISLDARWGEGKTFYVRQIEKTLEYVTRRMCEDTKTQDVDALKAYFQGTQLDSVSLEKSYLPIYYNAWLYDNHDDPIMSLLFTIAKKAEQYLDTNTERSIGEKIATLLSAISVSMTCGIAQVNIEGEKVKGAFESNNILKNIKTAEEIRKLVKDILNDVVVEKAERLVIFIDELDRCKPSYAIEMLERIKHYFDDERIIFIVSVNKEQLVHTISKYYGNGFDSTGYLNKFFDLNVHMPVIDDAYGYRTLFDVHNHGQFYLRKITDGLNEYYKLSLRDSFIYKQRVTCLPVNYVNDFNAQGCCFSLFIPIIAILDIVNENEKTKFMNGSSDLLDVLVMEVGAIHEIVSRLGSHNTEKAFEEGFERVKAVYQYTFNNMRRNSYNDLELSVSMDMKRMCMKLCDGFI